MEAGAAILRKHAVLRMAGRSRVNKKARGNPGLVVEIDYRRSLPAIAPTPAAAAKPAATAARTSAATAARLVLGLVDTQLPATHLVTVQALDGAGRISLAHLDEPEDTRATGLTIGRQ